MLWHVKPLPFIFIHCPIAFFVTSVLHIVFDSLIIGVQRIPLIRAVGSNLKVDSAGPAQDICCNLVPFVLGIVHVVPRIHNV